MDTTAAVRVLLYAVERSAQSPSTFINAVLVHDKYDVIPGINLLSFELFELYTYTQQYKPVKQIRIQQYSSSTAVLYRVYT